MGQHGGRAGAQAAAFVRSAAGRGRSRHGAPAVCESGPHAREAACAAPRLPRLHTSPCRRRQRDARRADAWRRRRHRQRHGAAGRHGDARGRTRRREVSIMTQNPTARRLIAPHIRMHASRETHTLPVPSTRSHRASARVHILNVRHSSSVHSV
eukprot:2170720-Pleurochrysis_carterae.AAC.2